MAGRIKKGRGRTGRKRGPKRGQRANRSAAENALRLSEERYRSFISQSSEGIWRVELDEPIPIDLPEGEQIDLLYQRAYFAECNEAMARMYGFESAAGFVGARLADLLPRGDPHNIEYLLTALHNGYRITDAESHELDANGNLKYFLNNFVGIVERGRLVRAWGTQRDITDIKRTEQSLRDSEERYRSLIRRSPLGILAADRDGRILLVNKALLEILGSPSEEATREINVLEFAPLVESGAAALFSRCMEIGEPLQAEIPYRSKWGRELVAQVYVTPIRGTDGETAGFQAIVDDITERIRTGAALHESELKFRTLVERSLAGIYIIQDDRFVYANPKLAEIFGVSPGAVQGKEIYDFVAREDRDLVRDNIRCRLDRGEESVHYEYSAVRPDGARIRVEVLGSKMDMGGRPALIGTLMDVTEQRRAEDELRKTTADLRAIFTALPDLYFRMSADGTILDHKAGRTEDLYLPPQEFLGKRMQDVLPPNVARLFAEALPRVRSSADPVALEYSLPLKQGEQTFEARCVQVPDGDVAVFVRNITEEKRAEAALIDKERYQALFERSLDCVYLHDFGGRILDANNAMLGTLGYTAREFLGLDFTELLDADGAEAARRTFAEIEQTGSHRGFMEYRLRRKDGTYVHLEVKASAVYRDGKAWAIQGVARNVTQRRRAEAALRQSEIRYRELYEKYRNILDSSPDAIVMAGLDGTIVECNRRALDMYGASDRAELIGRGAFDQIAPEDRDRALVNAERTLMEGQVTGVEYAICRKDDSRYPAELSASLVRDAAGNPVAFVGIIKDITERKRAEEALKESEEKFRGLFESSRDAIMTLEPPSWRFTSGNPATVAMFGAKDVGEFISYEPWRLSPERQLDGRRSVDKALEMIDTAMEKGSHFFEWTHKRMDGEEFPASVLLTRVEQAGKRFLQATVRDLTEQKRLEQQAIQTEKMAAVGTLIAGLSHELNNPIGVILGYAQSLLKHSAAGSPLKPAISSIEREAQRCASLVRVLLDFSRRSPAPRQRVAAAPLVRHTTDTVRDRAASRGVRLSFEERDGRCPEVYVNVTEIESAILNLVNNAVDAAAGVRGAVTVGVGPASHEGTPGVRVTVHDTGAGIPADIQAKVFEPFFTTKPVGKGTGLGLSLTRQIIESHSGLIAFDTALGAGTTFSVWLPGARMPDVR